MWGNGPRMGGPYHGRTGSPARFHETGKSKACFRKQQGELRRVAFTVAISKVEITSKLRRNYGRNSGEILAAAESASPASGTRPRRSLQVEKNN